MVTRTYDRKSVSRNRNRRPNFSLRLPTAVLYTSEKQRHTRVSGRDEDKIRSMRGNKIENSLIYLI